MQAASLAAELTALRCRGAKEVEDQVTAALAFLDMPNRYDLCRLLANLAHEDNKCIIFSTHELDIAQSLCDTIALIDSPYMYHQPTPEMIHSGYIKKLFKIQF